ncbi:MAG: NAD-dependent epimerase/dehydratase family protein [Bryobacteraceae bacterium]|jgi:UDP-glucose 4-epimerase
MRVLVTGGAGFIGSHLVQKLLREPTVTVRILDNLHRCCNSFAGVPRVEFLRGDIRDRQAVHAATDGIDVIYHLAAQSTVLGAVKDIDYSFTTNVAGTLEVLSAACDCGVRKVIFTSSREVYGQTASLPVPESAPFSPKNAYGTSKAAGELYCRFFAESGIDVEVLRLANVYGPGDSERVIPLFLANALNGLPLVIHGENKILDFVWIGDVVDALVSVQTLALSGQPLNIGSGEGTSLLDLAQQILRLTRSPSVIQSAGARKAEVDRFVADIRLAENLLDYRPSRAMAHLPEVAAVFTQKASKWPPY